MLRMYSMNASFPKLASSYLKLFSGEADAFHFNVKRGLDDIIKDSLVLLTFTSSKWDFFSNYEFSSKTFKDSSVRCLLLLVGCFFRRFMNNHKLDLR